MNIINFICILVNLVCGYVQFVAGNYSIVALAALGCLLSAVSLCLNVFLLDY